MPPLRLAMLGAGNVAESYVRQIRRLREEGFDVELAAICSRSLDPARRLAEIFGIPECGTDMAALLSRKDIDAVIVLTPMQCHAPACCTLHHPQPGLSRCPAPAGTGRNR